MGEERRIEYMPLSALKPNPDNVKLHDVEGIRASFERFGVIEIPAIDERTGLLVAGHGRVESWTVARDGRAKVPEGVEVDDQGEWWVPVGRGWESIDDDDAAAATVALNRWNQVGGWNTEKLLDQLDALRAGDQGLAGVGFGVEDYDDLLAAHQEAQQAADAALAEGDTDDFGEGDGDGRQVRSVMFDFPIEEFGKVTEQAARARANLGVDSNAELFLGLLRADAESAT